MRLPHAILRVCAILLIVLGLGRTSKADEVGFVIIVHPDNPITAIDRDTLRDAFLKKATTWGGGVTIRPIDLSAKFAARDKFLSTVVRKTAAQLKTYWNQQIFSGKGVPPPEADSTSAAILYVLANKGAVAFLPPATDPGKAKIIGLR